MVKHASLVLGPSRLRRAVAVRRGWALLDVIVGGTILGIGLAAIISLAERSLAMQQRAEREVVAATLLDGLLNEVLSVGPVDWLTTRASDGHFDVPFERWSWRVDVTKQGLGDPYRVVATVTDDREHDYVIDTLMAPRLTDDEEPERAPTTPIDRQKRYEAPRQ